MPTGGCLDFAIPVYMWCFVELEKACDWIPLGVGSILEAGLGVVWAHVYLPLHLVPGEWHGRSRSSSPAMDHAEPPMYRGQMLQIIHGEMGLGKQCSVQVWLT